MSNNDEKLMDHNYDGIQELDNDLPKWWVYIFYITIVFSLVYGWYYHGEGPGKSHAETFAQEMAMDAANQSSQPKVTFDQKDLEGLTKNNAVLAKGKDVYLARCTPCHLPEGGGSVGPNLTDDYWIHGGKLEQIAKTIHDGVPDKGMVAWGQLLSVDDIKSVTVYVKSLRGTHPPNPKAPQGNKEEL